jgi:hypothetical protein
MVKQGGTFFSLHKSKENILLHNSKQIQILLTNKNSTMKKFLTLFLMLSLSTAMFAICYEDTTTVIPLRIVQ